MPAGRRAEPYRPHLPQPAPLYCTGAPHGSIRQLALYEEACAYLEHVLGRLNSRERKLQYCADELHRLAAVAGKALAQAPTADRLREPSSWAELARLCMRSPHLQTQTDAVLSKLEEVCGAAVARQLRGHARARQRSSSRIDRRSWRGDGGGLSVVVVVVAVRVIAPHEERDARPGQPPVAPEAGKVALRRGVLALAKGNVRHDEQRDRRQLVTVGDSRLPERGGRHVEDEAFSTGTARPINQEQVLAASDDSQRGRLRSTQRVLDETLPLRRQTYSRPMGGWEAGRRAGERAATDARSSARR